LLSGYLKSYQRYLKLPTGLRSLSRTDATLSDKNRLLRCDCLLSNRYYTAITRAYVTIFGLSGGGMALASGVPVRRKFLPDGDCRATFKDHWHVCPRGDNQRHISDATFQDQIEICCRDTTGTFWSKYGPRTAMFVSANRYYTA